MDKFIASIKSKNYKYVQEHHLDVIKMGKEKTTLGALNDNQAIYEAAKLGDLKTVQLLMTNPEVDPADQDNRAIKAAFAAHHDAVVYELTKSELVREEIYHECKDNITEDEAKFLLYYSSPVSDASVLLEGFRDENDSEFTGGSSVNESLEYGSDVSSSSEDSSSSEGEEESSSDSDSD